MLVPTVIVSTCVMSPRISKGIGLQYERVLRGTPPPSHPWFQFLHPDVAAVPRRLYDVPSRRLRLVRRGRETAAVHGVFVKYLLEDGVGWPSEPRVVSSDPSCRRRAARPSLHRDGDDFVRLKTNADDHPSADIGAAPPAASTPELHPDPKLLVPHHSRGLLRSVSGAAGRRPAPGCRS
jgi:hypothetical protein